MQKRAQKYPLVFATIVSFLSVCTAGVSTFAWFQAQANVNVRASESSTTITVSNPDSDFAMRIYRYAPNNELYSVPYQPSVIANAISEAEAASSEEEEAIATPTWSDFKPYSFDKDTIDTSTLWAGYSITYCLVSTATSIQRTMKINGVDHTNSIDTSHPRVNTHLGEESNIDLCQAILVYGAAFATSTFPTDEQIQAFLVLDHTDSASSLFSSTDAGVDTLNTVGITATPSSGSQYLYFFITVHFSNAETTWYQPVENIEGRRIYNTPSLPASSTTYWKPYNPDKEDSTDGYSSQVYSGLSFRMTGITIG